jgi:hypothetical protein
VDESKLRERLAGVLGLDDAAGAAEQRETTEGRSAPLPAGKTDVDLDAQDIRATS